MVTDPSSVHERSVTSNAMEIGAGGPLTVIVAVSVQFVTLSVTVIVYVPAGSPLIDRLFIFEAAPVKVVGPVTL